MSWLCLRCGLRDAGRVEQGCVSLPSIMPWSFLNPLQQVCATAVTMWAVLVAGCLLLLGPRNGYTDDARCCCPCRLHVRKDV
eukprot:4702768-Alexandrium_andersonii.AAC.1